MEGQNLEYEVLNPWAETDPRPLSGLSPRVTDLAGATVGLLCHWKIASKAILTFVEERLKQRYPAMKTTWFFRARGADAVSRDYLKPEDDLQNPAYQGTG